MCASESGPSLICTPTCEALRKLVQQREGTTLLFDDLEAFAKANYKTLETSKVTTEESNKLRRCLVITRKMKVYDEVMELHDPLRLLVEVDGHYRALLHEKTLEEGTVQSPIDSNSLPILEKFDDVHLEIRPGVKDYSFFRASIGFDIKRALRMSWPPDTARDCDCSI